MNFRIVESDYTREFYERYARIKKDLSNGLKVKEIKQKYDLNDGKWRKYQKELVAEGLFEPRARSQKKAKFYTYSNGRFRSQKVINGRKYHIGTFKCKHDVELAVELMKECGWDLSKLEEVRRTVYEQSVFTYD